MTVPAPSLMPDVIDTFRSLYDQDVLKSILETTP
jgi:hypothetical protein